jgi:hypothetical protein
MEIAKPKWPPMKDSVKGYSVQEMSGEFSVSKFANVKWTATQVTHDANDELEPVTVCWDVLVKCRGGRFVTTYSYKAHTAWESNWTSTYAQLMLRIRNAIANDVVVGMNSQWMDVKLVGSEYGQEEKDEK